MEYIAHRINTVEELAGIPTGVGVELDLRDGLDGRIHIQHNPFEAGEDFEEYLRHYRHGTMILNIKSERIEWKILELLPRYGVSSYFFLDSSFPMIWLLSSQGEKNIALRVSEAEGLDTARNMAGRVEWIWVDCFTRIPIGQREYEELKGMGYKLCLVSPELQGRDEDIERYKEYVESKDMYFEAVCSKIYNMDRWMVV